MPLEGAGDVATLLIDYQACDETLCHFPVTDARLMSRVEDLTTTIVRTQSRMGTRRHLRSAAVESSRLS